MRRCYCENEGEVSTVSMRQNECHDVSGSIELDRERRNLFKLQLTPISTLFSFSARIRSIMSGSGRICKYGIQKLFANRQLTFPAARSAMRSLMLFESFATRMFSSLPNMEKRRKCLKNGKNTASRSVIFSRIQLQFYVYLFT